MARKRLSLRTFDWRATGAEPVSADGRGIARGPAPAIKPAGAVAVLPEFFSSLLVARGGIHAAFLPGIDGGRGGPARAACYPAGALRGVPFGWREAAFERPGERFRLRAKFRVGVAFPRQDIRAAMPTGPFDLVLCRNLVFTYFRPTLQARGRALDRTGPRAPRAISRRLRT